MQRCSKCSVSKLQKQHSKAIPVKVARDPRCPTAAERAAHEPTHLPFRIWCPLCVEGRKSKLAHSHVPDEPREVPEVAFDYAFISRAGDTKPLTILVTKDRDSKIIMGNVVLH